MGFISKRRFMCHVILLHREDMAQANESNKLRVRFQFNTIFTTAGLKRPQPTDRPQVTMPTASAEFS